MKNFKLIALLLLSVTLIFSSCSKDEEEVAAPTIAFSNGNTALVFNSTNAVDVTIDVTAAGKVASFTLVKKVKDSNGSTQTPIALDFDFNGEEKGSYRFQRTNQEIGLDIAPSTDDPRKVEYMFSLTDKEGTTKTAVYTVTKAVAQGTPFAMEKEGWFFHIAGTGHGAYDLDSDASVGAGASNSEKSMKNIDAAGDPFTGKFMSANDTRFVKDNTYDYTNATHQSAEAAFAAGTAVDNNITPAVNDMYIAKKGTTFYVIKITVIDPAAENGGNDGKMMFTYKK